MNSEKWHFGLEFAKKLDYTKSEYEEAIKGIDSPDNENELLVALIAAKQKGSAISEQNNTIDSQQMEQQIMKDEYRQQNQQQQCFNDGDTSSTSSSCHSSSTRFTHLYSEPYQSTENLHQQQRDQNQQTPQLKNIYLDGSNIAMTHGKDEIFSWLGIKICVDYFISRDHRVKVFVPSHKFTPADEPIINYLKKQDSLVKTPTGCNDDLFIIEAAKQNNGIIVSNDLYRDEKRFNSEMQHFIHNNRLPYVFVDDLFIPANDPLGRSGPTLDEFLRVNSFDSSNDYNRGHRKLTGTRSHPRYQRVYIPHKMRFNTNDNLNTTYRSNGLPVRSVSMRTTNSFSDQDTMQNIFKKPEINNYDHLLQFNRSKEPDNFTRQQVVRTTSIDRSASNRTTIKHTNNFTNQRMINQRNEPRETKSSKN